MKGPGGEGPGERGPGANESGTSRRGSDAPAVAERLLAGFIADPDLEEAVLGDLAEEWGERARDGGVRAANRWYRAHALRTAPHLLVAWWRGADAGERRETLGRAGLALAIALPCSAATFAGLSTAADGLPAAPPSAWSPATTALVLIAAGTLWAPLVAFGLACTTRRAPMAATAALGLGWIPAALVPAAAGPLWGAAPWLHLALPVTLALATMAGGAVGTLLRRPAGARAPQFDTSASEAVMTTNTETIPFRRRAARVLLVTAALLAVPLVAMQLTDEVVWTLGDFVFMGVLLTGVGLAYELAVTRTGSTAYRAAAGLALAAGLLLVVATGAVGVIGSEANPANLMYAGVLAVALAGAAVARFEADGMARAMVATAVAQAVVTAIAIVYGLGQPWSGPLELAGLNGFWIVLWLGSAGLFRRAGQEHVPAPAGAEG